MAFDKAGWLQRLVRAEVEAFVPPSIDPEARSLRPRARARRHVADLLRQSGLLYGTPTAYALEQDEREASAPEERLFLAVLHSLVRVGLEIAELLGTPPGPRDTQLFVVLATLGGRLSEAGAAARRLAADPSAPLPRRFWSRVESALETRAVSLGGDPAFGLVLHNGAVYSDAQLFCRLCLDWFATGRLTQSQTKRRLLWAAREKALLVEVLTALACVERPPSQPARRAILRQVEDLQLPGELASQLKRRVRTAFERRRPVASLVREVKSAPMRRLVLEQAVLAALVDGHTSPLERAFLHELSGALELGGAALEQVEREVAGFYARHREVVDVFTVSAAGSEWANAQLERVEHALEKNYLRLMQEVRETGELSVLLSRAARGQSLTAEERARMREQLLDIAKMVPALAIFAAPGGLLLLLGLTKVLGISLLPSAFREPELRPTPTEPAPAEAARPRARDAAS